MKLEDKIKIGIKAVMIDMHGSYDGYSGANAASKYLDDEYGINICCDYHANDIFCDEIARFLIEE